MRPSGSLHSAAIAPPTLVAIMRRGASAHRSPEEADPPDEAVGCRRGWRQRPTALEYVGELPFSVPHATHRVEEPVCCPRPPNPHR